MSRVEGKMSRVEGKMSRVQKCRLHSGFESLVKKPEFLGRFCIIELFTFLYTIEYFHAVSSIPKMSRKGVFRKRGVGVQVKNTEKN